MRRLRGLCLRRADLGPGEAVAQASDLVVDSEEGPQLSDRIYASLGRTGQHAASYRRILVPRTLLGELSIEVALSGRIFLFIDFTSTHLEISFEKYLVVC